MTHFTISEPLLLYTFPLEAKEQEKLDAFLLLLEKSGAWKYLNEVRLDSELGRPQINKFRLFSAIVYCFALGKSSLREIEAACYYDLRVVYLIGEDRPSSSTISRFISLLENCITPIFISIVQAIVEEFAISLDTVFLDGSKFEANSNKYKFVWKPTTFHLRPSEKALNLLRLMHLSDDVPKDGIISSKLLTEKLTESQKIDPELIEGGETALKKMRSQLYEYLIKSVEYEEKEAICGPDRNSYYKTDHDATAMCLKEDYYSGLGSQMHAAYNTQIVVCRGIIVFYYLSQDRSDTRTLIPTLEGFKSMYGCYPKRICADAGYGSFANYKYCNTKGIEAFIKYPSWNGERTGRYPAVYEYLEDGTVSCLGGRTGNRVEIPNRHPKTQQSAFYKVENCTNCQFMAYCRRFMKEKEGNERIFEVMPEYVTLKQGARDRLLRPEGIEMRVNRSYQVEGTFGVLKQNMAYTRFRRRKLAKVRLEFALTCLGLNIRKFLKFKKSGKLPTYWKVPEGLEAETFKKPSAKRIANRLKKRKNLQPNEIAKRGYRRKGMR